ncbi:hypothetical protein IAQ61_008217 [Plenodomus lingam]|uniref:Multiple myeloma tumor-associated protein 2-like N-terminal domain-containing protein n=1 Tax=Leptosphaeria maculans (strain JN3 / isolate v23.1.3 / race Av1-4-5-6-7-8) TaxID=985895 RepID=E4ZZX0_LEPMJ|nr:hypothetical protein LEMA_P099610.1 [Plenodomus lingam JN3]KAH9867623.1 hypothetical protein IAQ61_008217 [Plenodomus lingam]CBX96830.1 hypothetical protein LEMA_P099610.1 [Plenodomus lingam JN3]
MDLVQTVRKEGSRGGRGDFKWEDVKNDAHRENYLGHSLMAPVGRWQQGRDLSWYAKGDDDSKAAEAARIAEEKRKIKQAEEDAMLVAMGLPVPVRDNANLTPLGTKVHEADVQDTLETKAKQTDDDEHRAPRDGNKKERSRRHRDEHGERKRRHRSRSSSHDRERRHRHRQRSRSRDRPRQDRGDRHRHRSRSREHRRHDERSERPRDRGFDRKHSASPSREHRRRRDTRSRSPYANDRRRD